MSYQFGMSTTLACLLWDTKASGFYLTINTLNEIAVDVLLKQFETVISSNICTFAATVFSVISSSDLE